jgi:O-antigen/teichoic acid export membrane protein
MSSLAQPQKTNLVKNTIWLTTAEMLSRVLTFLVVLQLINYLGDYGYGMLSYPLAIANLCIVIADYGLGTYIVQQLPRNLSLTKQYIQELFTLKLVLSLISLALMLGISLAFGNINPWLMLAGGIAILANSSRMFVEAFFRAHQKMHLEATTKIISAVVLVGITLYFIVHQAALQTIAWGYALSGVFGLSIACILLWHKIQPIRFSVSWSRIWFILAAALPLALSLGCNYILNYLDSAMLGWWNQTIQLGWYSAAYKPIFFFTAMAGMIINSFFPSISAAYHHNRAEVANLVEKLLRVNIKWINFDSA